MGEGVGCRVTAHWAFSGVLNCSEECSYLAEICSGHLARYRDQQ